MKIHHFAILVTDIDRSLEFYIQKIGFDVRVPKTMDSHGYYYANISLSGSCSELELIQVIGKKIPKEKTPPLCPHIALESVDFEKDLQRLQEKGVDIFDGPHIFPHDVQMMTILDPDGYRIDIGQRIQWVGQQKTP